MKNEKWKKYLFIKNFPRINSNSNILVKPLNSVSVSNRNSNRISSQLDLIYEKNNTDFKMLYTERNNTLSSKILQKDIDSFLSTNVKIYKTAIKDKDNKKNRKLIKFINNDNDNYFNKRPGINIRYEKLNKIFGFKEKILNIRKEVLNINNFMTKREDYSKKIFDNAVLSFKKSKASIFAQKLKRDFMLEKYYEPKFEIDKKQKYLIRRAKIYNDYLKENAIELKDNYTNKYLESLDILRKVRNIFEEKYKIDYLKDENFNILKKYENRINFIYDIYHVPYLKNKLIKYKTYNQENNDNKDLINPIIINFKVWKNLIVNKIKIQKNIDKKKDENEEKIIRQRIFEENKKASFYKLKTLLGEKLMHTENYEIDNYFLYKKNQNEEIMIASDKLRNFVYRTFQ